MQVIDEEAALVRRYYGLAVNLARRFEKRRGDRDDLQQVALMALTQATRRFDCTRGVSFSTYATAVVIGALKRHLRDQSWAVRPTRGQHDRYLAIQSDIDCLAQRLGRAPTAAEVADATGRSIEDVIEANEVGHLARSQPLDPPSGPVIDLPFEERAFADVERREVVRSAFAMLSERDQAMLYLRFYRSCSQTEIAKRLGISQMEVSRSLRRIAARLRAVLSYDGEFSAG